MKEYTIREYINWFSGKKKLIALILAALTVGFGVLAGVFLNRPAVDPVPLDVVDGKVEEYAYVDAVGVSDWVYKVGESSTYYLVMDTEHCAYVVRIPEKDIGKYDKQRQWFDELSDEEIPVRIAGRVKKMNDTVKKSYMEVLELDEDEFDYYFGYRMLWAGETPSGALGGLFVFLTIAAGAATIALLVSALVKTSANKPALKRLEERGLLEQAEQALNAPDVKSLKNDRFRMDDRFLFGREMGLAAAWDDVRWCYIHRMSYNFVLTVHSLIINTADKKSHVLFFRGKREDEMRELMNSFAQYNPDMLLGYSMENQNAYRQSIKES